MCVLKSTVVNSMLLVFFYKISSKVANFNNEQCMTIERFSLGRFVTFEQRFTTIDVTKMEIIKQNIYNYFHFDEVNVLC